MRRRRGAIDVRAVGAARRPGCRVREQKPPRQLLQVQHRISHHLRRQQKPPLRPGTIDTIHRRYCRRRRRCRAMISICATPSDHLILLRGSVLGLVAAQLVAVSHRRGCRLLQLLGKWSRAVGPLNKDTGDQEKGREKRVRVPCHLARVLVRCYGADVVSDSTRARFGRY